MFAENFGTLTLQEHVVFSNSFQQEKNALVVVFHKTDKNHNFFIRYHGKDIYNGSFKKKAADSIKQFATMEFYNRMGNFMTNVFSLLEWLSSIDNKDICKECIATLVAPQVSPYDRCFRDMNDSDKHEKKISTILNEPLRPIIIDQFSGTIALLDYFLQQTQATDDKKKEILEIAKNSKHVYFALHEDLTRTSKK